MLERYIFILKINKGYSKNGKILVLGILTRKNWVPSSKKMAYKSIKIMHLYDKSQDYDYFAKNRNSCNKIWGKTLDLSKPKNFILRKESLGIFARPLKIQKISDFFCFG